MVIREVVSAVLIIMTVVTFIGGLFIVTDVKNEFCADTLEIKNYKSVSTEEPGKKTEEIVFDSLKRGE